MFNSRHETRPCHLVVLVAFSFSISPFAIFTNVAVLGCAQLTRCVSVNLFSLVCPSPILSCNYVLIRLRQHILFNKYE